MEEVMEEEDDALHRSIFVIREEVIQEDLKPTMKKFMC